MSTQDAGIQRAPAGTHGFHGFLFADLRGYTDFAERRGDRVAAELLTAYRDLVRSVVAEFSGAEVKTEGDSFYVVFDSASGAVLCGLAIVAAAEQARAAGSGHPINVGVGVHAGETADTAEGYVGSAVNLAARLCAQARAGEVLVSDTVRGLTRTGGEVTFIARGRKRLKGIAEPIVVYAATGAMPNAGTAPRAVPAIRARLLGLGRPRRVAIVIAGAAGAVALAAVLVWAVGGGFTASPSTAAVPILSATRLLEPDTTYQASVLPGTPTLTTSDRDWSVVSTGRDQLVLAVPDTLADTLTIQRLTALSTDPCGIDSADITSDPDTQFRNWVTKSGNGLTVGATQPLSFGGLVGIAEYDVSIDEQSACPTSHSVVVQPFAGSGAVGLTLNTGQTLQLDEGSYDNQLILIVIQAPPSDFDAFEPLAVQFLHSLKFPSQTPGPSV